MTIEAPVSKFRIRNLLIYIIALLAAAGWFAYDGFLNEKFIAEHTKDGKPDSTLAINQIGPFVFLAAGAALIAYLLILKKRKIVADDTGLIISSKRAVPYDSIEKIDKTNFKDKGFFVITFKDALGNIQEIKLTDRKHDNLSAILERLIEKIS